MEELQLSATECTCH